MYLASSTLGVFGSLVDFLAMGWLIVTLGANAWALAAFLLLRLGTKFAAAVPAGLLADRRPRATIYAWMRVVSGCAALLGAAAAWQGLLPLALAAAAISALSHALDLPAHRALQGEVQPEHQLERGISAANGGSHAAALLAPIVALPLGGAFGMTVPLLLAAAAFFVSAAFAFRIPARPIARIASHARHDVASALRFVWGAPIVIGLLLATALPPTIDKTITILMPSASGHDGGGFGLVLAAPEMGAIVLGVVLATVPWRFSPWMPLVSAGMYTGGVVASSLAGLTLGMEMIAVALFLTGCAKTALVSSALAGIQRHVPHEMRGRIMTV
jgi:MFS family permease